MLLRAGLHLRTFISLGSNSAVATRHDEDVFITSHITNIARHKQIKKGEEEEEEKINIL